MPRYKASLYTSIIVIYLDLYIDITTSFYNLDY